MDHLSLGVNTGIGAARADNPRSMLRDSRQSTLYFALNRPTATLYLETTVLCAIVFHDGQNVMPAQGAALAIDPTQGVNDLRRVCAHSTNSSKTIEAASPCLGPSLSIRVYPPGLSA
jgi:hypothetical protein